MLKVWLHPVQSMLRTESLVLVIHHLEMNHVMWFWKVIYHCAIRQRDGELLWECVSKTMSIDDKMICNFTLKEDVREIKRDTDNKSWKQRRFAQGHKYFEIL